MRSLARGSEVIVMYRIYWLDPSNDEWILYSRAGNEEIAYDHRNDCHRRHPNCKVKITKETIIDEA